MSTKLPLRLYRPLHRQCPVQASPVRYFSSTQTLARGSRSRRVDPVVAATAARQQVGRASNARQEEQLSDERNVPEDIGLIPGTFVHVPLFPLTQLSITQRFWYELKWMRSRAAAWFQLWRFRRSFQRTKPPVYWMSNRAQLKHKAVEKYMHFYDSFAKADSMSISNICVSNVADKFKERIDARPPSVQMRWETIRKPTCTIVSNVASPLSLPGYEETGVHQIIFRIRSEQRLKISRPQDVHGDSGSDLNPRGKVEEYMVMQRMYVRGSPKNWKIWGFIDPSTPASIERSEEYARKVNAYQAGPA